MEALLRGGIQYNQQSPASNRQPQQQLVVHGSSVVEILAPTRQVAYYSDFEDQQTLRGITTMRESTSYNQSQTTGSATNVMPSFTDSSGRKCVTRHTLRGWTNNRL
ncbi:hypothetical protein RND81_08G048800 [Saponaria officinalis]|uniref:Uncharacterized protein n=1 Tax=Saponaria officinalis TaxID=3572 RepID=A0AAW1J5R4_SAPOF